jgi:AraC family transcriptional regulator
METVISASSEFASFQDLYMNSAYAAFEQEHRNGGSFDVGMIQVEQDGHEFIDPPIAQLAIVGVLKTPNFAEFDFGDGWTDSIRFQENIFGPQPANQECKFRIKGRHSLLAAYIPESIVRKLLDNVGVSADPIRSLYAKFSNNPDGMNHLLGMWNAMKLGGPANNLIIDAHVIALLGLMMVEAEDNQKFVAAPKLDNPRLSRVIEYIELNFSAPIRVTELASIAVMSPIHFGRSFKIATRFAPYQYLTARRIEHSRRMLRSKQQTITEIGYICGFASPAHFSSVFTKVVGKTPSAYRTQTFSN